MFRKKWNNVIGLWLVCAMLLVGTVPVHATDTLPVSPEEVFPAEEVMALLEKVSHMQVEPDKVDADDTGVSVAAANVFGSYPRKKGLILVTPDKFKGIIPFGHAAIVYKQDTVVEAMPGGVTKGDNNWNTDRTACYGLAVKGTTDAQNASAADWCYLQIGKPYNINYWNTKTRDSFYCSHLVWAAFYDNYGIDLSTSSFGSAIHPLELVDSSNTYIIYRQNIS